MSIQFAPRRLEIPRGTGTRVLRTSADFRAHGSQVRNVSVVLQGFKFDHVNPDRPMNVIEVSTAVTRVQGTVVEVEVRCQYADRNFDDPFEGFVAIDMIADVV